MIWGLHVAGISGIVCAYFCFPHHGIGGSRFGHGIYGDRHCFEGEDI